MCRAARRERRAAWRSCVPAPSSSRVCRRPWRRRSTPARGADQRRRSAGAPPPAAPLCRAAAQTRSSCPTRRRGRGRASPTLTGRRGRMRQQRCRGRRVE
eukprot:3862466-Pleurochrysis_carterae.AAC.1